jgi:uncharacterized membrane protein
VRKHSEKGLALLTFALSMMVLVPILGLAVDCAMLYVTKERLNSAVQLSLRSAQRSAEPAVAVNRYFSANFPHGFLGVTNRTIQYTPGKLHASVQAPTYFMRIIHVSAVNVEATAMLPSRPPSEVAAAPAN